MDLKKYLAIEKCTLISPLSTDEIRKRLADNIEPQNTSILKVFNRKNTKPYEGRLYGTRFKISRIIKYRNSFLPVITGTISSKLEQTQIDIKMQATDFVLIFMSLWIGVMGLASIGIFIVGLLHFKTIIQDGFSPAVLIPFGMFLFGMLLVNLGFRPEANQSKAFLMNLFEAREL